MSETMRVNVDHGDGKMACLHLPLDATIADVVAKLEEDPAVNVPEPKLVRMIGNGSELEGSYKLESLGEFYFMRNAIYLRKVDTHACREWQRTGRCTNRDCPHKATHDMSRSPRYVAHQGSHSGNSTPQTGSGHTTPEQRLSPREHYTPATASPPQTGTPEPIVCIPANTPANTTICRNWQRHGCCRFGEQCHFVNTHTPENLPCGMLMMPSSPPKSPPLAHQQDFQMTSPVMLSHPSCSHEQPRSQPQEYETYFDKETGFHRLKGGAMLIQEPTQSPMPMQHQPMPMQHQPSMQPPPGFGNERSPSNGAVAPPPGFEDCLYAGIVQQQQQQQQQWFHLHQQRQQHSAYHQEFSNQYHQKQQFQLQQPMYYYQEQKEQPQYWGDESFDYDVAPGGAMPYQGQHWIAQQHGVWTAA